MNIDALSKKYGPLPGSVWLLLIFAGVYLLIKRRQAKAKQSDKGSGGPSASVTGVGRDDKRTFNTSSVTNSTFNMAPGTGGGTFTEAKGSKYYQGDYRSPKNNTTDSNNPYTESHVLDANITVANQQRHDESVTNTTTVTGKRPKVVTHGGSTSSHNKKVSKRINKSRSYSR